MKGRSRSRRKSGGSETLIKSIPGLISDDKEVEIMDNINFKGNLVAPTGPRPIYLSLSNLDKSPYPLIKFAELSHLPTYSRAIPLMLTLHLLIVIELISGAELSM